MERCVENFLGKVAEDVVLCVCVCVCGVRVWVGLCVWICTCSEVCFYV